MARTVQNARLGSRTSRLGSKLGSEPEWQLLDTGLHLGYWRGAKGSRWLARFREPGAATKG
jgi:hypothetical protein